MRPSAQRGRRPARVLTAMRSRSQDVERRRGSHARHGVARRSGRITERRCRTWAWEHGWVECCDGGPWNGIRGAMTLASVHLDVHRTADIRG